MTRDESIYSVKSRLAHEHNALRNLTVHEWSHSIFAVVIHRLKSIGHLKQTPISA